MRWKNRHRAFWDFIDLINKNCTFAPQIIDDIFIVNNFMAYINGSPVFLYSSLNNFNHSNNAGTKSSWLRQNYFFSIANTQPPTKTLSGLRTFRAKPTNTNSFIKVLKALITNNIFDITIIALLNYEKIDIRPLICKGL